VIKLTTTSVDEPPDPELLPDLTIYLEQGDSEHRKCQDDPLMRYRKYTSKRYTEANAPNPKYCGRGVAEVNLSVLALPDDLERDWWGTPESYWMRQKVRRAVKLGYEFATFDFNDHVDDIYEINTSTDERQGRAMADWYRQQPSMPPFRDQPCDRHRNDYFGVFKDGKLSAYALVVQCGEMMLFSQLLGHADRLEDGIVNFLIYEAATRRHSPTRPTYAVYHVHHSGTPGLQFFKRKMGFAGYLARWELTRRPSGTDVNGLDRPATSARESVA
jgi:hypothetical protein